MSLITSTEQDRVHQPSFTPGVNEALVNNGTTLRLDGRIEHAPDKDIVESKKPSSLVHNCCKPSRLLQYVALIIVVMFTVLGGLAFQAIEYDHQLAKVEKDRNRFRLCIGNNLRFTLPSMTQRYDVIARRLDVNCFKPPSAISYWSFENAALFAYCVCTTIGYGHLVPETANGRLFCSFYAIVGVPLTMIAIANIGKYISDMIQWGEKKLRQMMRKKKKSEAKRAEGEEVEETKSHLQGDRLVVAFLLYLVLGSALLSLWETDMPYFVALYFNIQSLTTMGFGDMWPKNEYFMWVTLLYLTLGLAIATIALSVFSDYLRRLHYYGQRITNAREASIRVGGNNLTVGRLLSIVANQLGVEQEELENLNLEEIVEEETNKLQLDPSKKRSMLSIVRRAHIESLDVFEEPLSMTPELGYDAEKVTETVAINECGYFATVDIVKSHACIALENNPFGYEPHYDEEEDRPQSALSRSRSSSRSSYSSIAPGRHNRIPIRKKEESNKPVWSVRQSLNA